VNFSNTMNIKNLVIRIFLLFLLLVSFTANAVDIQVKVDRTQIELNETFTLIFESSESPDDDPDFSPLKKDFQILNKSTSSNISIVNGEYTRSQKWIVLLKALHEGTITIPAISFGDDTSPGYQITITQPKKSSASRDESFISELEISNTSAFPQQQVIVTQRLLSSSNINAYEFSPLKTSGVDVITEKLGEIKQYQTNSGGTPYLVLEQSFVIYPQTSGTLTIEPSVASARIALQNNRGNRSTFDPFRSNTKTLRRSSDKKEISVKAMPDSFKGKHWLAAKEVQLVEEFPESTIFKVGEPITRTILLLADGQNSSQLPEIITASVNGLKQYPDKPLLQNNTNEDGITGAQQIKIAIIPSAAGSYTLPEISIPWWNIESNTLEYAKIKPRTFTVSNSENSRMPDTGTSPSSKINEIGKADEKPTVTSIDKTTYTPDNSLPWKITSFLLATGLLISLFLLLKRNKTKALTVESTHKKSTSLNSALKSIKTACENSNEKAAKDALLQWAGVLFINQHVHSLGDISTRVDKDLAEKIEALNLYLYSRKTDSWKCSELFELCQKFTDNYMARFNDSNNEEHLENLYK